jgi:hypothetical protein
MPVYLGGLPRSSESSEARDRYERDANAEINYRPPRIEVYRRLATLATTMNSTVEAPFPRLSA